MEFTVKPLIDAHGGRGHRNVDLNAKALGATTWRRRAARGLAGTRRLHGDTRPRRTSAAEASHRVRRRHGATVRGARPVEPLQDTVSRYIHPDYPEIYRVSNKLDASGQPLGRKGAGTYWHSDVSFREQPASASILHAIEIPEIGGNTLFANMTKAFADLSEGMKNMLRPLNAVHDFEVAARTQYAKPIVVEDDMAGANRAVHPLVRTHDETGAESLFVNPGFTSHIDGFDADESRWILEPLYRHATRPEYIYRHQWQPHDVLVWDNRSLMHYAIADYGDAPRYLERTTCIGERPV